MNWRNVVTAVALIVCVGASEAELQNVELGGEVRIRARHWNNVYVGTPNAPRQIRIPNFFLPRRPIGPFGAQSRYLWDNRGTDLDFVEQRTRLNAHADFTNNVSAFIELESYDLWGTDFRSNYITGADGPGVTTNDVEVYQAYIEANEMFGMPLRLRIGRQEMQLGKGWLVDDITTAIIGRSFDAARLTYDDETFEVDAFYSMLVEGGSFVEDDDDITMAGVYGTYKGMDALKASLYWLWIRDPRSLNDTNFVAPLEWLEDVFGLDDYDVTNMHTVGARLYGGTGHFDYDLELAYQFGEADAVGFGFVPVGGIYGDDGAEYDTWAGDFEIGYTAEQLPWSPRFYAGAAYFGGEDNRDLSFMEWANPFYRPDASVSFNRLFPGAPYSLILEIGQDMSNFWTTKVGVTAHPTDSVTVGLKAAYFETLEPFDAPLTVNGIGGFKIPVAPALSFLTQSTDDDIGATTHVWAKYDYTEDLFFRIGWEHLFTGDGLADGSFVHRYGLEFNGGTDDEDADYIYFDTGLKF